ncbi:MAG: DUF6033 family protein [Ruminiclostridium sp.]
MVGMHGIASNSYGKAPAVNDKKSSKADKTEAAKTSEKVKSGEQKLSAKAQKFLEQLRKSYGDYDFVIADKGDDMQGLMDRSKEFSVVFSSEELEKMAEDENFAKEQMQSVETAVNMSKKISEQLGADSGISLLSVGVTFDDKGISTMFAELEKATADRNKQLEEKAEERAEEKKDAEKADKNQQEQPTVKRATVTAANADELLSKILGIDWDKIPAEVPQAGDNVSYSA